MKRKFDFAIGMGPACSCSQTLRKANAQYLSLPFDWIGPDYGKVGWDDDLRRRTDLICREFKDWLRPEDFTYRGDHPTNGKGIYFNNVLSLIFTHDFPKGIPMEESFPSIKAKYERRIARLFGLLESSKNVLIARVDRPDLDYRTPIDDCHYAVRRLGEKFPQAKFHVILLQPQVGISFKNRIVEEVDEVVTRIAFDYQDRRPGNLAFPMLDKTGEAVAALIKVRDYRTPKEKREKRDRDRKKAFKRFGVKNGFQLRLVKIKNSIRKRLGKISGEKTPES